MDFRADSIQRLGQIGLNQDFDVGVLEFIPRLATVAFGRKPMPGQGRQATDVDLAKRMAASAEGFETAFWMNTADGRFGQLWIASATRQQALVDYLGVRFNARTSQILLQSFRLMDQCGFGQCDDEHLREGRIAHSSL